MNSIARDDRYAGASSFEDASVDPAGLLPAQREQRYDPALPERRLMAAVLAQALEDHRRSVNDKRPAAQRLLRRTRAWFRADEPNWPYSFTRICAALDLDADTIRARLLSRGLARPAYFVRVTGPRRRRLGARATEPALERRVA